MTRPDFRVFGLIALTAVSVAPLHAQAPRAGTSTSVRTVKLEWTTPVGTPALARDLGGILDASVKSGDWGVIVVSRTRGDTLFNRNADRQLLPASTMKVFTAALALDVLGPDHTLETVVLREGAVAGGTLTGNLVIKGAGDPAFGGKSGANPLKLLAQQVADAGIKRVSGAVIADGSAFDGRLVPEGWLTRYLHASYAARVSALSYNENLVAVRVAPVKGTTRATVTLTPTLAGLPVTNAVTVRKGSRSAGITVRQDAKTGAFRVGGWVGSLSVARSYSYVVENPELFVAAAFRAALADAGVSVAEPVDARRAAPSAVPVARYSSQPVRELVTKMTGESNNHFAELIFRNTARQNGRTGSADAANALLGTFLTDRVGTLSAGVYAADGSGLSTADRVTPRSLVGILDYSAKAAWAPYFTESLPVAGKTETLRTRMRGTPAAGRLRAKTGTTSEVTSLGGYVTAANGEELVFAFIYNGSDRFRAREAIDAMGSTLASFTRF
jgi:D-alanyl-D-alanine carboxypeptidase/D-alanyl-D-alanine-endopeptidase (penicillin-binding protein 4)